MEPVVTTTTSQQQPRKKRKTLLCVHCKRRKIRCDRGRPCDKCLKYGRECKYFDLDEDISDGYVNDSSRGIGASALSVYDDSGSSMTGNANGNRESNGVSFQGRIRMLPFGSRSSSGTEENKLPAASTPGIMKWRIPIVVPIKSKPTDHTEPKPQPPSPQNTVYLLSHDINSITSKFTDGKSVIGINPIGSPQDKISFFNYQSLAKDSFNYEMNQGPFTWHAFIKLDPAMAYLSSFLSAKSKDVTNCSDFNENGERFTSAPFQVLQRLKLSSKQFSDRQINKSAIPLGLNFVPEDNEVAELLERIRKNLPNRAITWVHVNRFFRFLYPFVPLLDEYSFTSSLEKIIGSKNDPAKEIHVKILSNTDYAVLGILLVVLRISYLSLISNDDEFNNKVLTCNGTADTSRLSHNELVNLSRILKVEIGIESTFLAQDCFNKFEYCQKTNVVILQLAVMLRIYYGVAPEDPEGPSRNQFLVCTGLLVQIAYSLGLNRDPDNLGLKDVKENNIRRKLWHYIVYLDLSQAMCFGSPITINPQFADTKYPFYEEGNSNIGLFYFHQLLAQTYSKLQGLLEELRNCLTTVLQFGEVPMSDVVDRVNKLEIFVHKNIGQDLREFVKGLNDSQERGTMHDKLFTTFYIDTKIFLMAVYMHILLYYEKKNNLDLMYFYLKKITSIMIEDLLPNCFDILDHLHLVMLYSSNVFTNPAIEVAWHNTNGFIFAMLIRVEFTIRSLRSEKSGSPEYISLLETLLYFLSKCAKASTIGIYKLGKRYLHAWRIAKSHVFILKNLHDDEFFRGIQSNPTGIKKIDLKREQLVDLRNMLEKTIMSLNKSTLMKEWLELFEPSGQIVQDSLIDSLFSLVTSTNDPLVFENDNIASSIENYFAFDNPYFNMEVPWDVITRNAD
ncbi:Multidrug resistance regulator 1 [Candida viswanathii]|uniref:Multidrug resistance regulator 1 n=1 Tax=Candida viswanathii TaxID=5486 RepID=A0A367Y192_9ASCO|nr:Multidrug resistance regulator 1 [Candida viswanathii]